MGLFVPLTTSASKSRGGRVSGGHLNIAKGGVGRSTAVSLIPFINRDNTMQQLGQGLSAAGRTISGIAADKERIETSVKEAAERKREAEARRSQAQYEAQQREMNAATAWDITKQVYQETRSLRDELVKRQGQEATNVNRDFVEGYQAILDARLEGQSDDVRKMVEKGNWSSFSKWENETHSYEMQQLEVYKSNAFNSKMELHVSMAAENLDDSDQFEDNKLDYMEMLEARAQEARVRGGNPDAVRMEGMDIFHGSVFSALLKEERYVDAKVYLKTNNDEMSKESVQKCELLLKPLLQGTLAKEKAEVILRESKGNPLEEMDALKKISDPEVRAEAKMLIDSAKKNMADQEESIINEVTQAAIANGGTIPPDYNKQLTSLQITKIQEGVTEWQKNNLINQKKVGELSYDQRDEVLNKFYMQPEQTAKMSESDVVGLMRQVGADNSEQKSIRDYWLKVKSENSVSKADRSKQLIEITDASEIKAINQVIADYGFTAGTTEFNDIQFDILEEINDNPELKTPTDRLKAAQLKMLSPFESKNNKPLRNHEITDKDRDEGLHLSSGAKDGDNVAKDPEVIKMWSTRLFGEIPADLTLNYHGVLVSRNSGNREQGGLVYDPILLKVHPYNPPAPKAKPAAVKGKDVEWRVRPDYPGRGAYYCEDEDKWYHRSGKLLRIRTAKEIEANLEEEKSATETRAMSSVHYSSFGMF